MNIAQEAEQFDPSALYLEVTERRRDLDKDTTRGAEVVIDLQEKGPLYRYGVLRRERAAKALEALVEIDPNNTAGIAALQVVVREYVAVCDFIDETLAAAQQADQIINQEFGDGSENAED